ncbi:MAG TPA: hypothetical protein VFW11_01670 [Cyclobacteriaceae bacterium]|nr:hypothetical protein [Cyclobacteriaceae bacterium]
MNSPAYFGQTARTDLWWIRPLLIFIGLSSFIVYATWAAFQGDHYAVGPYLSPFYSPEIFGNSPHSWFGPKPNWWPNLLPFSPALLILWAPGGMRLTCYYYRGAYYKSFWADPPACAVSEPRKSYRGENSFPLILQNVHRYFMYLAVLFVFVLIYDAWKAMWFIDSATGEKSFGVGVGTLVLALNATLLGGYTFGCHSFRHLVGGIKDRLSESPVRKRVYSCASCLNRKHMIWAWCSLFSVAFSDIYVRLCSMGIWTDWRIF